MNKVFFIGNLTKEPELTQTTAGISVCNFSIAVNRKYKGPDGERKTDYFECTAWRGLAETVAKYVHKGNKISVEGSMEQRSYEDSKGIKRTAYTVVVQAIEFLSSKSNDGENEVDNQLQPVSDDSDIPF